MKYNEDGFWIEKNDNQYIIGLSEKGQDDLGEVGFVSLLDEEEVTTDTTLISVEAAKAVSGLTSPLAGKVVKVNRDLEDNPEHLNSPDKNENWIAVLTDVNEDAYQALKDESGLEA